MANSKEFHRVTKFDSIGACTKQQLGIMYVDSFIMPYMIEPTEGEHDYKECDSCQTNLKSYTEYYIKAFNGQLENKAFPDCCQYHKKLYENPFFRINDFIQVPEWTAKKLIFTKQHIRNNIDTDNAIKEITDYIEYVVRSFGAMPNKCGEPLFLYSKFLKDIRHHVSEIKFVGTDTELKVDYYKQDKILEYIDSIGVINDSARDSAKDLNILIGKYQEWLKVFPFDISFFKELKEDYENSIPFFKAEDHNKYTGLTKARLFTKDELIDRLLSLTKRLIKQVNSYVLYKNNSLNEPDVLKLEILLKEREFVLENDTDSKSKNPKSRYIKVLKRWLKDEKQFISEITPYIKKVEQDNAKTSKSALQEIWLAESKLSIEDLLQIGIDAGIWNEQFEIIVKKKSLYGTGKTLLSNLAHALKGYSISEEIDYKVIGKAFCQQFNIAINQSTKEPYKQFNQEKRELKDQLKRVFSIK